MNYSFQEMFSEMLQNHTFVVFFVLITIIFFGAIIWHSKTKSFITVESIRTVTPSLILSIAILGTFTGILLGLFDLGIVTGSTGIQQDGVSGLIQGLKIAFGTSVYGLAMSLVLRVFFVINRRAELYDRRQEKNVDDLFSVLSELKKSFTDFTDDMGDKTVDALIKAIQQVMDTFNTKINDQLGQDFKELSVVMKQLNTWQDNYRKIIEEETQKMSKSRQLLETAEESITSISQSMSGMPDLTNQLAKIIETMNIQTSDLTDKLEAFKDMKEKALEAMPLIQERMDKLTSEIEKAIDGLIQGMKKTVDDMGSAMTIEQERVTEISKQISEGMKQFSEDIQNNMKEFSADANKSMGEQQKMLFEMSGALETSIQGSIKEITGMASALKSSTEETANEIKETTIENYKATNDLMINQLEGFGNKMEKYSSEAIQTWGAKLTGLSEKFAKDYEPLTEKLKTLIEISKSIDLEKNKSDERKKS